MNEREGLDRFLRGIRKMKKGRKRKNEKRIYETDF